MSGNLNTSMNGTQPSNCSNPTAEKIGYTLAYCVLLVVSLAGNSFIGIIVYKTKAMRKPINYLIVNMAMSDLLFTIFVIPPTLEYFYRGSWQVSGPLGPVLCKLLPFLTDISVAVSIQSLVLIAVDRFGAVVFPFRSPFISSKLCLFFILATWIVAMSTHSPYLFANKLVEGRYCTMQWNEVFGESSSLENYFVALIVVFRYFPLALIAIVYIIIYLNLKTREFPGEQSVNAGQQRAKRERNVLKMANAIVVGFAVCWLPISVCLFLELFAPGITMTWSCGFGYFRSIALFMAHANGAINPCICFIFSENYRRGLKNLLSCF